jgi:hypothetical protein
VLLLRQPKVRQLQHLQAGRGAQQRADGREPLGAAGVA